MYETLASIAGACLSSSNQSELSQRLLAVAWLYLAIVAIQSYFFPAPYGKFTSSSGLSGLNSLTKVQVPASLGWFIQEVPSFLVSFSALIHLYQLGMMFKLFLLAPYILHYFNRSIIFPVQLKNGKPTPVLTVMAAFMFCLYNGLMQSQALILKDMSFHSMTLACMGLVLFMAGMGINVWSDNILKSLRKDGETGYKIPFGGLYKYVTCPNYFGEAIEWWGFVGLVQTWASLWFAVFTTMFLGCRAWHTHSWYRQKFKSEYPPQRRAFLPLLL